MKRKQQVKAGRLDVHLLEEDDRIGIVAIAPGYTKSFLIPAKDVIHIPQILENLSQEYDLENPPPTRFDV